MGPGALLWASPLSAAGGRRVVVAPLTTAMVQGDETWLVVPMGHLTRFLNTFWQLFVRNPTDSGWVAVTPPGVADNGGLVITAGPDGTVVAGFLTSQDLRFSPLSMTSNDGQRWEGVYFPEGLIPVPDALVGATVGPTLGLGRSGGGRLFASTATLSPSASWHSAMTEGRLGRSTAGARCGVARLTATAVSPDGDPLVGVACRRPGEVGIFDVAGGQPRAVRFPNSAGLDRARVSVLRMVPTPMGTAVLLSADEPDGRTQLVAGWVSGSPVSTTVSAPFVLPAGDHIVATGTTPASGVFVLVGGAYGGGVRLADILPSSEGHPGWNVLPDPPRGTLGAAFSLGRIDVVTVHSSTLIDYALNESSAGWVRSQTLRVPIQYGSSS
jgi:hypothetical protein